jgi:hypothetical protein
LSVFFNRQWGLQGMEHPPRRIAIGSRRHPHNPLCTTISSTDVV